MSNNDTINKIDYFNMGYSETWLLKKKIRFLKMHTSTIIDNIFNWNKSRRQNPEIV